MAELANQLPTHLLDEFRLACLEAAHHVEAFGGSIVVEVKLFLQETDAKREIQYTIVVKEKAWRSR